MDNPSFEIEHDWGDPREPEYRNNSKVSFAYYKEGDIYLSFSLYPLKPKKDSSIVMEVPANIRVLLNNDLDKCEIIIQRVVKYLNSLDESKSHRKFENIIINNSKVKKWLPTQLKLFEEKHPYLNDTLPAANTAPFIIIGLLIIIQKEFNVFSYLSNKTVSIALIVTSLAIMAKLFSDIYSRMTFCNLFPMSYLTRTWTMKDTLEVMFNRYWRRYLVTLCISLTFIGEGLK